MTKKTQKQSAKQESNDIGFPRDENGYGALTAFEHFIIPEEELAPGAVVNGFEINIVTLVADPAATDIAKSWIDGDNNISNWNPSKPEGDGWVLSAICEHEEGPFAVFAKPAGEVELTGKAYAQEFPVLANDLRTKLRELRKNEFVTVPETTLPNGTVVPLFKVGKYITGRIDDQLSISESAAPWVKINFFDATAEAEKAGLKLITELQYLALAHNIASVAANWTSGVVGKGSLYQGLHDDKVEEAQAGDYVPEEESERRWFELSNGERIFDAAGNCYTWIFDDVQGNDLGIVSSAFAEDSPSITTAPAPSMENGVGWYPRHGANWSGRALVRGGCWYSYGAAGVFFLYHDRPDGGYDVIGFRCTLP